MSDRRECFMGNLRSHGRAPLRQQDTGAICKNIACPLCDFVKDRSIVNWAFRPECKECNILRRKSFYIIKSLFFTFIYQISAENYIILLN